MDLNLHTISTLAFKFLLCINNSKIHSTDKNIKDVCIKLMPDKIKCIRCFTLYKYIYERNSSK